MKMWPVSHRNKARVLEPDIVVAMICWTSPITRKSFEIPTNLCIFRAILKGILCSRFKTLYKNFPQMSWFKAHLQIKIITLANPSNPNFVSNSKKALRP